MPKVDPRTALRAAALDITVATTHVDSAWVALETAEAGWPTSTPGAAAAEAGTSSEAWCNEHRHPCTEHQRESFWDDNLCHLHPLPCRDHPSPQLSIVERTAGTDKARAIRDEIRKRSARLAQDARWIAKHTMVWGTVSLDKSEVSRRIDEIDSGLWCINCARFNMRTIRKEGGSVRCEFCQEYKDRWKDDPSQRIFDCKQSRGGKLYENDIIRIRGEEKREAEEKKKADKARAEAERRAQRKAS